MVSVPAIVAAAQDESRVVDLDFFGVAHSRFVDPDIGVVGAAAAGLLAGCGDQGVGIDRGHPAGPSRLAAGADVRDRQRAEEDQVGIDFAVAAELGGEVLAPAHRAYVAAQKIVGRLRRVALRTNGARLYRTTTSRTSPSGSSSASTSRHIRAARGMPDAANFARGEGFFFGRDEFAGAADLVAEFSVGKQHPENLSAAIHANKFAARVGTEALLRFEVARQGALR